MPATVDWSEVEAIASAAEVRSASIGVTIIDPDGATYARNGDRRYRAASTVKIPLMIEIYRQIDRGERTLDDRYRLRDEDRANGSGVLLELHDGIELTIRDLVYLMISISDNTATNILIDMAGLAQVNTTMASLGMTASTLGRKMKGRPAEGDEPENWATPNDYAAVVQAILDGRAASAASCAQMTAMLETQQNKRRIARYLPETEGIRWGTKTGSIAGVTNDAGFITTPNGTLIVSVFCDGLADQHLGEQVIGDISRAAMTATGVADPLVRS